MIKNIDDVDAPVEKRGGASKPLVTRKGKPDGRSLKNAASASIAREALKEYIKKGKKACTKKEEKAFDSDSDSEIVYNFPTLQETGIKAVGLEEVPVQQKAGAPEGLGGISSGGAPLASLESLQKKIDKLLSKRKAKKEKKKAMLTPPLPPPPPPSPAIAGPPPAHSVTDSLRKKFLLRF